SPVAERQDYVGKTIRVGDKGWATMPYNGVGGVFRIRPDGTNLRSFSRGLRNPCGLCFDKNWNLFTNDNDHEGLPSAYVPGRLLHVTEGSYFSWPRGWLQSKSPDRADLLPSLNEELGRFVPVLQTYYADGYLPEKYDNNLLVARWCRRQVTRYPLEAKGSTFTAKEHVLLEGSDQARPVGVCVGRGGRVFVTICYMTQNEGSPVYRSDLVVITRKDDPDTMPFDGYDITTCDPDRLQKAIESRSWWSQNIAHQERMRRPVKSRESGKITNLGSRGIAAVARLIQIREMHENALPGNGLVMDLLKTADAFRRVPTCLLLAEEGNAAHIRSLLNSPIAALRQAGVLTAGFRLTIPPLDAKLPDDAPLAPQQKEEANIILFADEKEPIDLRKYGRVGNYTVAEHWKTLKHTAEQENLFSLLVERLGDDDDKVRLQAAHFLSLLNDPRTEPKIASVTAGVQDKRLNLLGKLEHVRPQVWMLGPVPDADGFQTVHSVETAAIDLAAKYAAAGKSFEWKLTKTSSPDRPLYNFNTLFGPSPNSSVYSLVRFDVPTAQRMQLLVGSEDGVKVWHNGKLVFTNDAVRPLQQLDDVVPLDLLAGSNDILVRVRMQSGRGGQYLHFKHLGDVKFSLPEKPDGLSLADRLKSAGTGSQPIDAKFFAVDWSEAVKTGDVARGKKLFGAESLGCAKCHAATATQPGGGGPSLADSGKRFSVAYLVESVLAPNKVISPVFKSSTIETKDGKVITGLVVSETGEKLEVLLPDTKRISINKSDIEARKLADISAMPQSVVKTTEELRDVIAYLLSNPTDSTK
ncbi:MAG: c-type cytochrome, partial [Planctomycetaceae bacterium]|nr:c-type cytochrome [Planctomycetaceae bacterium]